VGNRIVCGAGVRIVPALEGVACVVVIVAPGWPSGVQAGSQVNKSIAISIDLPVNWLLFIRNQDKIAIA